MEIETTIFLTQSDTTTDLDLSFTSCTSTTSTDRTFTSSSARSSLRLSFNESRLSTSGSPRPHRKSDSHWSAINAATNLTPDGILQLHHLKLLRHLGSGNFGKVFLCKLKDFDGAEFALKVVDRDALTSKKLSHVQMESEILSVVDHPFLPTLYAHLEVSHYTCMLMDYCSGGDLHSLLRRRPGNRFGVDAVRFFASEVLVGLEYLHAIGVVYRDLKPENILIREDGHIMLSDFDLCFKADVIPTLQLIQTQNKIRTGFSCFGFGSTREGTEEELTQFVAEPTTAYSRSCVGTHEYLAPELVNGNGHGNGVDWWAFGVFIYELLYGRTPFKGTTKEATLHNIASSRTFRFPDASDVAHAYDSMEVQARDLIEKLLVKDPLERLGCARGASDIKRHSFFDGIKWPLIRTYTPPQEVRMGRKTSQVCYVSRRVSPLKRKSEGRSWSLKSGIGNLIRSKVGFNFGNSKSREERFMF
ncbi:hypothetical protein GIB67_029718 [Kingdonia uniflora]|uniref:non-specific serine/threonine protein kinase n=1 Tax=Kingdonia uniflora TaxID=39325 RepID=A0A7J7LLV4_9MAGN|nr:hypothetical protein GIB67_029718 [Kingdonia uniflora]